MSSVTTLPHAIRRHAAARPLALAVHDAAGDLSFGELDGAVDVAVAALQASGIAPGDRVALLTAPSGEALALLAGIVRAGAVAVPLGSRLTRPEIAGALEEATPVLLLHDADLGDVSGGHGVPALAPAALLARAPHAARRSVDVDPEASAVAVLTSGTTGRPRAALLSHRALAASAAAWEAALPPATGWLLCLGLAHVAGLGVVWRALGAGVPLHVGTRLRPGFRARGSRRHERAESRLARAGPAGTPPRGHGAVLQTWPRPPPCAPSSSAGRRSRPTSSVGRRRPAGR